MILYFLNKFELTINVEVSSITVGEDVDATLASIFGTLEVA
jgi:hypothetical protein